MRKKLLQEAKAKSNDKDSSDSSDSSDGSDESSNSSSEASSSSSSGSSDSEEEKVDKKKKRKKTVSKKNFLRQLPLTRIYNVTTRKQVYRDAFGWPISILFQTKTWTNTISLPTLIN